MSTDLRQLSIKGNIASNREYVPVHDSWHKTFRLAYWLDSRYYGQTKAGSNGIELKSELEKYDIDYYFLWDDGSRIPQVLSDYQEVTQDIIPGLRIYSLKEKISLSPSDAR